MIVAPVLIAIAGLLAAQAIRAVDRAIILDRSGRLAVEPRSRHRHLTPPGLEWRWWPLIGSAVGWTLGGLVMAGSAAAGVAVGTASVRRRRTARLAATVDAQLADAVRSLAAGMRAGLSLEQALAYAAREGEPPLGDARQRIVDSVGLGGTLDDALRVWASEIGTDDARLVVGVLGLHRRTGGDLPRVLDQVAIALRERTSAAREVRALTAQARLSGAILGLLPVGFFAFLWLTSRAEIEGAFRSPIGIAAVVAGVVLETAAFLWIRKLLEVT
jgi:tight adherence protein B